MLPENKGVFNLSFLIYMHFSFYSFLTELYFLLSGNLHSTVNHKTYAQIDTTVLNISNAIK